MFAADAVSYGITLKREEGLENPTFDRMRRVMSMVYRHGQRYGLISRSRESNPMRFVRCKTTSGYEAMIITPEQAHEVVRNLREPERTLTLLQARALESPSVWVCNGKMQISLTQ